MSVLETFLILFESNSADVKRGAAEAKKTTDDLEKTLGASDKAANKLSGSFMSMARGAALSLAGIVSVGAVLNGVFASARIADNLGDASAALGIAVEDISAFGDAAKKEGGSVEGFIGTVTNLSAALAEVGTTGKSRLTPFFNELGISLTDAAGNTKDIIPILYDVAEAFEGMSKQESLGFGKKLGIDMGTIILLQQGRIGLQEVIRKQKELGVVTEEQARVAGLYNNALDETSVSFRSLFLSIGEKALPAFTSFLNVLNKTVGFIKENGTFLTYFLTGLGTVIAIFVVPPLVAAAAAFLALNAPIIAIGSAILAFIGVLSLLVEDIQNFKSGAPSLIGEAVESMADSFTWLKDFIFGLWDGIVDYITESIEAIMRGVNQLKEFLGFGDTGDMVLAGGAQLSSAAGSGISSQTSNSIVSTARASNNSVSIGEVNIQTQATDADGIANAIGKTTEREIRQVQSTFDDGVKG